MGSVEVNIAKQYARTNQPLPERIANKPELLPGLQLYLQAFFDLDSERSHAMAPTAIPWSSMIKYCEIHGIEGDQRDDFVFHVKRLDSENLKRISAKMEK